MKRGNKRKFGRVRNQRAALYKALATALIEHGKIETTDAKAKSLATFIQKLVTKSSSGDMASRKQILGVLGEKATKKLFSEISPKYKERKGGYTRIIRTGQRKSDGAPMAIIEFIN